MKEQYKYRLWASIEKLGWIVVPIPASGGGRRGIHRPDIIIGNKVKVFVAEVKNCRLPLYLSLDRDVLPVIHYADALKAQPIFIVKRKFAKEWLVFRLEELEKCTQNSYVINQRNISIGQPLDWFLNTHPNKF